MRDPKGPVKPYRSPEEVAKRHKVPLEKIIKQVRMGTKVEGEHTTSKSAAKITALQHVDEFPDYYSKLKKVEKIKEGNLHQWFSGSKDKSGKPGWVNVVTGDSCASDKPGEGVPKCVSSSKRDSMTPAERRSAAARKRAADPDQQEKSGAAKPTYVSIDKKKKMKEEFMSEEDKKGKSSGEKDACYHKVKARFKVWPSAYASGALVKCRKAGASNWGNKSEETEMVRFCPKCVKNETRNECKYGPRYWDTFSLPAKLMSNKPFSIATVHPANMPEQVVKEDHKEIASGKKKDEEGYMANIEFDQIERAVAILRKRITKGNQQIPAWVQSKITRAADFIDTAADYMESDEEVSEAANAAQQAAIAILMKKAGKKPKSMQKEDVSEACWTGYKQVGMKKKGKKIVPNCVPANEDTCISFSQFMQLAEVAAWQKKAGKNPEGGLNKKGISSYRREHPGSKLSLAVTKKPSELKAGSKSANRRKSFCARMSGMKSKLTSAKTANDPDSRINKSLRKWNC